MNTLSIDEKIRVVKKIGLKNHDASVREIAREIDISREFIPLILKDILGL